MSNYGLLGEAAMEQTCDEDIRPAAATTAPENLLSSEMVELSTVEPELSIDAEADDWLIRLLRYDDENASSSNSGDS